MNASYPSKTWLNYDGEQRLNDQQIVSCSTIAYRESIFGSKWPYPFRIIWTRASYQRLQQFRGQDCHLPTPVCCGKHHLWSVWYYGKFLCLCLSLSVCQSFVFSLYKYYNVRKIYVCNCLYVEPLYFILFYFLLL